MSKTNPRKFSLPTFKSRTSKQDIEEFLIPTSQPQTTNISPAIPTSPSFGNLQQKNTTNRTASNSGSNDNVEPFGRSTSTGKRHLKSSSSSPASSSDGSEASGGSRSGGNLLVPNQMGYEEASSGKSPTSPSSPRMISSNNNTNRKSKTPPTMSPPSSPRSNIFQWFSGRGKTADMPEIRDNELKIGLFGCEGTGKSTLFKQCEKIYGGGYSEKAVFHSTTFIQQNLVEVLRTLFEGILKEQQLNGDIAIDWTLSQKMKNFLTKHTSEKFIGDRVLEASTWYDILQDSRVKDILENIHEYKHLNYSIGNCIEFYVEEYERLTSPQYRATEKDYITFQQKTTGVISRAYSYKDKSVILMDIGGVRTERKKWSAVMKCCQALVYVVSLAEFDEVCWEDITTNRFMEDLSTFKDWIKNESIKNQPVFLVFTNVDRFNKKINQPRKVSILNTLLSIDTSSMDNAFYLRSIINKFMELDQDKRVCDTVITNSLETFDLGPKMSRVLDTIVEKCK